VFNRERRRAKGKLFYCEGNEKNRKVCYGIKF
jgi:hypothetical protein